MVSFPKYERYKDSGVEWLGQIPKHWDIYKNKFLFTEKKVTVGKNSKNFILLSLTLNGVIKRDMENPQGKFPAEFDSYKVVEPNDLIFCLFDVEETPRTVGHSETKGMITGAYDIFECDSRLDSKYIYYYYLSLDFDKRLQPLYTGLRKVIKKDAFFSTKSPVPPLEEQRRIVEFLDRKCGEIEDAIAHKKRLIELLEEQKTILINQAVTKGLDPNAPMKDSGIEWLGKIPEHWEIKQLGYTGSFQNGVSEGAEYFGSGYPFVNYTDVYNNPELPKQVVGLAKSSKRDREKYSVEKGDIFFTRTSETIEELGIASTCLATLENAIFSGFLIRFRPFKDLLILKFQKYYFRAQIHRFFFAREVNLVTRASLSQDLLKRLPVLFPPKEEQDKIVNFLECECIKINQVRFKAKQQIEKLTELKQILIAEAVTGKIKI